jgi:hypothetical protein
VDAEIKTQLIETLQFPRYMVRAGLDLEDCPHEGTFLADDLRCQECLNAEDCDWLFQIDETVSLEERPLEQLVRALGYALESVSSLLDPDQHGVDCRCQTCNWRHQAGSLYGEVRCHPMLEPPPAPE